ncbi:MFS transporter [Paenibacillus sambharensis]|uniref:MFS transporter n=1 Tax=Paenibacillus sambharensis TaxID=1803190 RepID=UPI001FE76D57|nr:MFS transporter [Paenibacillus sambharensis]
MKVKAERFNIWGYTIGRIVSLFGTAIYQFALGLYVLQLTGSAMSFAITLMLGLIPAIVLNPLAGAVADRWDKKVIVVTTELGSGLLMIVVYLTSSFYGLELMLIYTAAFLLTVLTTFYSIGLEAAKPNIVSERRLMTINSVGKIIESGSTIMGPMLGGIIFALIDIRLFVLVNGISFLLSGLCMLFIQFRLFEQPEAGEREKRSGLVKDMREGWHYLMGRPDVRQRFAILILLNFFLTLTVTVPLPYILTTELRLKPEVYGVVQAAFPAGMIAGAMMVTRMMARWSYIVWLSRLSLGLAVCMIAVGIPVLLGELGLGPCGHMAIYSTIMLSLGIMVALIDIPLLYYIQREVPELYRGRVLSLGVSAAKILVPVAMAISGLSLSSVPVTYIPTIGGVLFLLFTVYSTSRAGRNLREREPARIDRVGAEDTTGSR